MDHVQVRTELTNEHGSKVDIVITRDEDGATIAIFGQGAQSQAITLTTRELKAVEGLLWLLQPGYRHPLV